MTIDELIEKLYELKREFGDREVKLFTSFMRYDDRFWDEYDIDEVYFGFSEDDGKIIIQGKETQE